MATIRVNGATRQSGSGFHSRKGEPGRARTRSAVLDSAVADQIGVSFRFGGVPGAFGSDDAADPLDRYADWDEA